LHTARAGILPDRGVTGLGGREMNVEARGGENSAIRNSGNGVLVRPATAADAADLARLRYEFRIELDPPVEAEGDFVKRCGEWMAKQLGSNGLWRCWVAESGPELVGTIWLQLIEKLPNPVGHPGFHGYISSVYVRAGRRNGGIGSALLTACLAECRARGLDAVFLWPTESSRSLYQRHGFALRDDLLERRE
jgi:ribosomal protein S18 acetylase RimI-like enzyme